MTSYVPMAVGACLVVAAFLRGPSFYPPGEGYAEERRNILISTGLALAGILLLIAPLVIAAVDQH